MKENEQKEVLKKVLEIGDQAKNALRLSMKGLIERDIKSCEGVEKIEEKTDYLNFEIEELCLKTLANSVLSDKDFRFFATMLRISERFERIGDLSVKIAEQARRSLPKPLIKHYKNLSSMSKLVFEMLDINLEAIYRNKSVSEEEIRVKDNAIDFLYEDIYGRLVAYVHQNPKSFDDAILLLNIASTLERIGDISCKIANRVIYMVEGRRVWLH